MKTSSTADIVKVLEKNNELIRIKHEVDPYLQMAEIQRRIYRDNGPAILFENASYKKCDTVILVTAPKPIRIERILARDKISKAEIEQRMNNQWSDEDKIQLADIVINNIDLEATKKRVEEVHKTLLFKAS